MKRTIGFLLLMTGIMLTAETSSANLKGQSTHSPIWVRSFAPDTSILRIDSFQTVPHADSVNFTGGEGRIWTVRGYKSGIEVYVVSSDSLGILSYKFPASTPTNPILASRITNLTVSSAVKEFDLDLSLSAATHAEIGVYDTGGRLLFSTTSSMLQVGLNHVIVRVPNDVTSGTYMIKVSAGTDVVYRVVTFVRE